MAIPRSRSMSDVLSMARRNQRETMAERVAVYAGSFDPVTLGHLDILDRASLMFDRVIVSVLSNPTKLTPLFSAEERVELIKQSLDGRSGVDVTSFDGLTVEFAARSGAIA